MMTATPNREAQSFDVIVIGAGINGAGIARDAAMRGLRVLLLDKGDICSGTSAWSTRLIHGGLRYLEHGEFGLVRESLRERECLLKIAPHLVRPLEMVVPIYAKARRGYWTMRAGMLAYDVLSFDKTLPRHRVLSSAETLAQLPGLDPVGLLGAAVYYDAQVEFAERLVLENVLAATTHGASVITHALVEKLIVEGDKVVGVEFTTSASDQRLTGTAGVPPALRSSIPSPEVRAVQEHHSATARVIVNAAGPWIDNLLADGGAVSPRLIGGTKGSHIIVAPFRGAPVNALYVEASTDHRPFFVIPWNDHYLIGTTDIRYNGDLDHVRIEENEIDYLLRETNRVIPLAGLRREDILYTYAGVRPLAFTSDQAAQSITRRHFIRIHPEFKNLCSIVGGKLTTYRRLAEETVDLIFNKLRRESPACSTANVPLPGAATPNFEAFCKDFKQSSRLTTTTNNHLLRTYGTRASLILKLVEDDELLGQVLDPETGAIAAEVVFAFKHELAQTLADCFLRRTMVGLNSTRGLNVVEAAAKIAQQHLGWTHDRAAQELAAYRAEVSRGFRG
ncbi:MAG TPA: glycerol-3-phosphate dehydrogenase/oxidase [Pyrinomonadaceae bacterium]|nr:glycerol-3-phosphate dehydrogenase/oxidase [Pyrinomonadaceae bacterium]